MDAEAQVCTYVTLLLPAPQQSQSLPFEIKVVEAQPWENMAVQKACRYTMGSKSVCSGFEPFLAKRL